MKIYSIVRIDNEYVVQAGENSILKIASRRRAARLVIDAAELLDLLAAAPEQKSAIDRAQSLQPSVIPEAIPEPREVA
jgi:hypothetical protein